MPCRCKWPTMSGGRGGPAPGSSGGCATALRARGWRRRPKQGLRARDLRAEPRGGAQARRPRRPRSPRAPGRGRDRAPGSAPPRRARRRPLRAFPARASFSRRRPLPSSPRPRRPPRPAPPGLTPGRAGRELGLSERLRPERTPRGGTEGWLVGSPSHPEKGEGPGPSPWGPSGLSPARRSPNKRRLRKVYFGSAGAAAEGSRGRNARQLPAGRLPPRGRRFVYVRCRLPTAAGAARLAWGVGGGDWGGRCAGKHVPGSSSVLLFTRFLPSRFLPTDLGPLFSSLLGEGH